MDRRSIIKACGASIVGSSLFMGTSSGRAGRPRKGVRELEKYTRKLNSKHGGINNQEAAILTKQGELHDTSNISKTDKINSLNRRNLQFGAVEEFEYKNGEILTQVVEGEENVIKVSING